MKSMMTMSKSLLLFAKVAMVMSTWRNTKCDEYSPTYIDDIVYAPTSQGVFKEYFIWKRNGNIIMVIIMLVMKEK